MNNRAKIDIVTNEVTYEPMYQITMAIPLEAFDSFRIYGLSRTDAATTIGTSVLDDLEAFIEKRQNERLHTVTK
jgi:hypothetical protein